MDANGWTVTCDDGGDKVYRVSFSLQAFTSLLKFMQLNVLSASHPHHSIIGS